MTPERTKRQPRRRPAAGAPRRQPARRPSHRTIDRVLGAIGATLGAGAPPAVSELAQRDRDPFRILVSTVISLRTKDAVTDAASRRLFAIAPTAATLAATPLAAIERAIFPAGFYRTKARTLRDLAERLMAEHGGIVPDTIEGLLAFKGVGRKTAALVVSLGYGKDAICVDTHVHRIANRLGWVVSRTPDATEQDLMRVLPSRYWIGVNELFVGFGQRICTPLSPRCSECPVRRACRQVGVTRKR